MTHTQYPRFFPTPPKVTTDNITLRAGSVGDFVDRVTIATVIFETQEDADMVLVRPPPPPPPPPPPRPSHTNVLFMCTSSLAHG